MMTPRWHQNRSTPSGFNGVNGHADTHDAGFQRSSCPNAVLRSHFGAHLSISRHSALWKWLYVFRNYTLSLVARNHCTKHGRESNTSEMQNSLCDQSSTPFWLPFFCLLLLFQLLPSFFGMNEHIIRVSEPLFLCLTDYRSAPNSPVPRYGVFPITPG
jgi:hypothetical protein